MGEKPTTSMEKHFVEIRDPRIGNAKRHKLIGILVIAICAVICGVDGWGDIELFEQNKQGWLKKFLELPNGIPSHDIFGRVFAMIEPVVFRRSFMEWVQAINDLTQGVVMALDGKQLRGSGDKANRREAINLVSAWATANQ